MAIELKTIDIILATASVVIFIIVFFFVFQFRKLNKKTSDQEKELEESVVAMPVEMISETIRDAAPPQIEMPGTADLKLEDIFPEQAVSFKPEIVVTQVLEIQSRFNNEFSEKPADVKSSEHENITNENVELKLEDELPEKLIDSQTAQIAHTSDALAENSGGSNRVDGHSIDIPKTTKPNKKCASGKKTGAGKEKGKPKPGKKAVKKRDQPNLLMVNQKKIENKKSKRKSTKIKKKEGNLILY